jgi:delta8-fatty-acid desaturase
MSAEPRGKKEPWVLQQLRTTMDVDCPEWMDWFHGGLQFQTIHHLFPRMPKHNLRKASERVKLWCKSVGARYEIYGFVECNGRVVGRLEEVAKLARAMGECQKVILEKGDYLRGDWE